MKLNASTLRYQINKYRNDEDQTVDYYIRQNEELRFELSMVKKMKETDQDDDLCMVVFG